MPVWKADRDCTIPGGRFFAAGETCEGAKAPCSHFSIVKPPAPVAVVKAKEVVTPPSADPANPTSAEMTDFTE